jgi:hypothetical protein
MLPKNLFNVDFKYVYLWIGFKKIVSWRNHCYSNVLKYNDDSIAFWVKSLYIIFLENLYICVNTTFWGLLASTNSLARKQ